MNKRWYAMGLALLIVAGLLRANPVVSPSWSETRTASRPWTTPPNTIRVKLEARDDLAEPRLLVPRSLLGRARDAAPLTDRPGRSRTFAMFPQSVLDNVKVEVVEAGDAISLQVPRARVAEMAQALRGH